MISSAINSLSPACSAKIFKGSCSPPMIYYIDCCAEVETGVSLVNYLQLLPLDEAAHLRLARQDVGDQLSADLLLVVVLKHFCLF